MCVCFSVAVGKMHFSLCVCDKACGSLFRPSGGKEHYVTGAAQSSSAPAAYCCTLSPHSKPHHLFIVFSDNS